MVDEFKNFLTKASNEELDYIQQEISKLIELSKKEAKDSNT